MSFKNTGCKETMGKKKVKSKAQNQMEDKKSSKETLRMQKLVHPLMSSNCLVDSHTNNTR